MTARQRHTTYVATFVLIGAIAGLGTAFVLPRTYVSSARLLIEAKRGGIADWFNRATQHVLSRRSLRGIIEAEGRYQRELERLPMDDLIEKMRRDLQFEWIGQVGSVREVRVSFRHEDGAAAELTTRALMDRLISPGTAAEVLEDEPSWQPLSLEVAEPPRPVHTARTGVSRIGSALIRLASIGSHDQITYAGVLRVRGPELASESAQNANQLKDMVLSALKDMAYLKPEGESLNATMSKVRRRLRFETGRFGDELTIFYSDTSAAQAQRSLQELVNRAMKGRTDSSSPVIEQFDPPILPNSYEELTPSTMATVGAGIGLLLGFAGLARRMWLD